MGLESRPSPELNSGFWSCVRAIGMRACVTGNFDILGSRIYIKQVLTHYRVRGREFLTFGLSQNSGSSQYVRSDMA